LFNRIDNNYYFSHNRIHEAVYSIIPDEKKVKLHYCIGKQVLHNIVTLQRQRDKKS